MFADLPHRRLIWVKTQPVSVATMRQACLDFLGEAKVHLLAAYVYGLGGRGDKRAGTGGGTACGTGGDQVRQSRRRRAGCGSCCAGDER